MHTAWHYDTSDYKPGKLITQTTDHMSRLTGPQKIFEQTLRDAYPNGHTIRATSVYLWANQRLAEFVWSHTKKGEHLFEVSFEQDDIRFSGDIENYSLGVEFVANPAPTFFADRYWKQQSMRPPKVEILVAKATIVKKLFDNSQKVPQKAL